MTRRTPRIYIATFLAVGAIISLTGYIYFQAKNLLAGPTLEVLQPQNGSDLKESSVVVSGKTANVSFLTLNGMEIFTNENGEFSRSIILLPGYNVLTIEAKDKFNKITTKTIQLTYSP